LRGVRKDSSDNEDSDMKTCIRARSGPVISNSWLLSVVAHHWKAVASYQLPVASEKQPQKSEGSISEMRGLGPFRSLTIRHAGRAGQQPLFWLGSEHYSDAISIYLIINDLTEIDYSM